VSAHRPKSADLAPAKLRQNHLLKLLIQRKRSKNGGGSLLHNGHGGVGHHLNPNPTKGNTYDDEIELYC
jgi:hypothetical protein